MENIPEITIEKLMKRYSVLLLDAYGVLVHTSGALEGASDLIAELNRAKKPYFILTNDASKLPETGTKRFRSYGLEIHTERIITSGALLKGYFESHRLTGARCAVLGPEDSLRYVEQAGGRIVSPDDAFEVLVICDETGFPFRETIDTVMSTLFHLLDRDEIVHMVLSNPDLIFPKSDHGFALTAGSIALVLEAALKLRYPDRPELHFARLGKPYPAIFEAAIQRSGTRDMVMIGDQIETDIRGANSVGLDSALVGTGVSDRVTTPIPAHLRPTYRLRELKPHHS
ncbi:MAG: HAD-IIA family hydrolase [Deltaproteobacteria bacterium]|nr:MAG: HAD-IIA family hydrolase [Deltaproteobacteria bacterium]